MQHRPKRLFGLLCALLVTACDSELATPPAPTASRIIVLGIDGLDPNLLKTFVDAGRLPNFAQLIETGHFQPLATTMPPQSPVAWASFATGTNPGSHGIYDFVRRDPSNYQPAYALADLQPGRAMEVFGYRLPLFADEIISRRHGASFWQELETTSSERTTTLRIPGTFPVEKVHRQLAGMGVPDLLGTQGSYSLIASSPVQGGESARILRTRPDRDGVFRLDFPGPDDPIKPGRQSRVPVEIRAADGERLHIRFDDTVRILARGTWSDWIELEFDFALGQSVKGMVRLHANEVMPNPQVYVSPIHWTARQPPQAISSPPSYAAELADKIGNFHTLGMPEETWSLTNGHLSDRAFLSMERTILAERKAMWFDALERQDSDFVAAVFVQLDRISHVFWRGIDAEHPLHDPSDDVATGAIGWIHHEMDQLVGETLERLRPEDTLVVVSDHGFAPFRWQVDLNRWLIDRGWMTLDSTGEIDWGATQAYALGLNGLWINQQGRESSGTVDATAAKALTTTIADALEAWVPAGHTAPPISNAYEFSELFSLAANDDRPDLLIGYRPGYRASWSTALGAPGDQTIAPNTSKWSGDHCIDSQWVPGVLLSNRPLDNPPHHLATFASWVRRQ